MYIRCVFGVFVRCFMRDGFQQFLEGLQVSFDFDGAQARLEECERVSWDAMGRNEAEWGRTPLSRKKGVSFSSGECGLTFCSFCWTASTPMNLPAPSVKSAAHCGRKYVNM